MAMLGIALGAGPLITRCGTRTGMRPAGRGADGTALVDMKRLWPTGRLAGVGRGGGEPVAAGCAGAPAGAPGGDSGGRGPIAG